MKITMSDNAHHRISGNRSQFFRTGQSYSVPRATGVALVERGVATEIEPSKPSTKQEH